MTDPGDHYPPLFPLLAYRRAAHQLGEARRARRTYLRATAVAGLIAVALLAAAVLTANTTITLIAVAVTAGTLLLARQAWHQIAVIVQAKRDVTAAYALITSENDPHLAGPSPSPADPTRGTHDQPRDARDTRGP